MSASVEKLEAARALVARGWTQGAWAKTDGGFRVILFSHVFKSSAVCWCSVGALGAVGASQHGKEYGFLQAATGVGYVEGWNDTAGRKKAEVLAAYDRAIDLAKAEAGAT